jgi:hypothetical protein
MTILAHILARSGTVAQKPASEDWVAAARRHAAYTLREREKNRIPFHQGEPTVARLIIRGGALVLAGLVLTADFGPPVRAADNGVDPKEV